MTERLIKTTFLPIYGLWCATCGEYSDPSSPVGYGKTESLAVEGLMNELDLREIGDQIEDPETDDDVSGYHG